MHVFLKLALIAPLLFGCAIATEGLPLGSGGSGGPDATVDDERALKYFTDSLVPVLRTSSSCAGCHALPKDGGSAPTTIYNYGYLRPLLVSGPVTVSRTNVDNRVMQYLLGQIPSHASGLAICGLNTLDLSPCKEIVEWGKMEGLQDAVADTSGGTQAPATIGRVSDGGVSGFVYGWAADSDTPATPMTVEFYANGPRGSGTLLASTVANLLSVSYEKSGNVGFRYVLPDTYRNGSTQLIYAYGLDNNLPGTVHELTGSPISITGYLPEATASSYYTSTVVPFVTTRCLGCHSSGEFAYSLAFYSLLLSPSPEAGGSATNNVFYRKMMGLDSHRGGAPCGGSATAAPCNYLLETWTRQFD